MDPPTPNGTDLSLRNWEYRRSRAGGNPRMYGVSNTLDDLLRSLCGGATYKVLQARCENRGPAVRFCSLLTPPDPDASMEAGDPGAGRELVRGKTRPQTGCRASTAGDSCSARSAS